MKMFLSAVAASSLSFSIFSYASPEKFYTSRKKWKDFLDGLNVIAVIFGGLILGAGMAISGACPGMVLP